MVGSSYPPSLSPNLSGAYSVSDLPLALCKWVLLYEAACLLLGGQGIEASLRGSNRLHCCCVFSACVLMARAPSRSSCAASFLNTAQMMVVSSCCCRSSSDSTRCGRGAASGSSLWQVSSWSSHCLQWRHTHADAHSTVSCPNSFILIIPLVRGKGLRYTVASRSCQSRNTCPHACSYTCTEAAAKVV